MSERIINCLNIEPLVFESCPIRTRNRLNIPSFSSNPSDNKNFVVRLFIYKNADVRYRKKVKFNSTRIKKWASKVREHVKLKILEKKQSN